MNLLEEMARDAGQQAPAADKLGELSTLVQIAKNRRAELEKIEAELAEKKKELADIEENKIPDLFDELQLSQVKLATGETVNVKSKFVGSITKDKEEQCFAWLEEHGFSDLIKHDVTVKLKKGENEEYEKVAKALEEIGVSYLSKDSVHNKTLDGFINEQVGSGKDFPQELFSVYNVRKTVIK